MVKDAEANAEEDKKFVELAAARNQADGTVDQVEKALKEVSDLPDSEKTAIEAAIAEVKTATKGNDKADIEAKAQALITAAGSLLQKAYAQTQGGAAPNNGAAPEGDILDAEFTEKK
jgi:molecular chaperone DnaK